MSSHPKAEVIDFGEAEAAQRYLADTKQALVLDELIAPKHAIERAVQLNREAIFSPTPAEEQPDGYQENERVAAMERVREGTLASIDGLGQPGGISRAAGHLGLLYAMTSFALNSYRQADLEATLMVAHAFGSRPVPPEVGQV